MTLKLSDSQSFKWEKIFLSEKSTATLLTSDLSALTVRSLLLSLSLGLPVEVVQSPALVCVVSGVYSMVNAVLLSSSQFNESCSYIITLTLCKFVKEQQLVVTCVLPNSHSLIAKKTPQYEEQKTRVW